MNINKVLNKNSKYLYNIDALLQKNRDNGWQNIKIGVKAIATIYRAIDNILDLYGELMSLMLTMSDYYTTVNSIANIERESPFLLSECYFNVARDMLFKVITEIHEIGVEYDEMEHLIYTYFLVDRYEFKKESEHFFLVQTLLNGISGIDKLAQDTFNKTLSFINKNDKHIKQIRENIYITSIYKALFLEDVRHEIIDEEFRDVLVSVSNINIAGEQYTALDILQQLSIDIVEYCC